MTAALFLQIEHKYQMMMKLKMPSFEIFPFVLIPFFIRNCNCNLCEEKEITLTMKLDEK